MSFNEPSAMTDVDHPTLQNQQRLCFSAWHKMDPFMGIDGRLLGSKLKKKSPIDSLLELKTAVRPQSHLA